jgi:hypothetical protein
VPPQAQGFRPHGGSYPAQPGKGSQMGICEVLTIIFVIAKLLDKIDWSWWWVLCPMYPSVLIYIIAMTLFIGARKATPRWR